MNSRLVSPLQTTSDTFISTLIESLKSRSTATTEAAAAATHGHDRHVITSTASARLQALQHFVQQLHVVSCLFKNFISFPHLFHFLLLRLHDALDEPVRRLQAFASMYVLSWEVSTHIWRPSWLVFSLPPWEYTYKQTKLGNLVFLIRLHRNSYLPYRFVKKWSFY